MFLLRTMILMIFPLILSCAGGNASLWKPYSFDGTAFSPAVGRKSPAIWLRSGHFPTVSDNDPGSAISDRLPSATGAVAGICYQQSNGGKLSAQTSFSPYPDEQITLRNIIDGVSVTRTDKNGYFTEYLPAGSYELFCRGIRAEFRIIQGETTLVPIRGGKRMVD